MAGLSESEPNDSSAAADLMALGDTITGALSSPTDKDYFKIVLAEPTVVRFTLTATGTYDDFTFGLSTFGKTQIGLVYLGGVHAGDYTVALDAGTTYFDVFDSGPYSGDTYTLSVQRGAGTPADYETRANDTPATATPLPVGERITGQVDQRADVDVYAIDVTAGSRWVFNFDAPNQRGDETFRLSLLDAAGHAIDELGTGGNASLFEPQLAAGRYYLQVASGVFREYGNYAVSAHTYTDSALAGLSTTTSVTGSVSAAAPLDLYSVDLVAGHGYDFFLSQAATGGGTLDSATLSLLTPAGQRLETASLTEYTAGTTTGLLTDPHIAFIAPATGRYTVAVDGAGGDGSYTLSETLSTIDQLVLPVEYVANAARTHDRWNSTPGTTLHLTFGFMTQMGTPSGDNYGNFAALSESQKQAVRDILAGFSTQANITFTETTDLAAANLRYGLANLPGTAGGITRFNGRAGDGYFGQNDIYIDNLPASGTPRSETMTPGALGYLVAVHETGHALGLKHPGDYDVVAGSASSPYLPTAWDQKLFAVMSYNDFQMGGTYGSGLATLDIAALQSLYGVPAASGTTNFSVSTSVPVVLSAPVGHAGDAVDASAQTVPVIISLTPGTLSSIGVFDATGGPAHDNVTLPMGSHYTVARGGSGNDLIFANSFGNNLSGNAGDDRIYAGAGNDSIAGGSGFDTAVYANNRGDYTIAGSASGNTVSDDIGSRGGNDSLEGVERLEFADGNTALDLDGAAGAVARVIGALLGKQFLDMKDVVGIGVRLADAGMGGEQMATLAAGLDLFVTLAGSHSNSDFVRFVFNNVVGVAPTPAQLDAYTALLDDGTYSQGELGWIAAQTALNDLNIGMVGLRQHGLDYAA
ncbi:MAG TPA: M10 family metallopeptidase [Ramlibacter sp.]|nr:M10 family metallopeptidase [Ramlibacter sp.]